MAEIEKIKKLRSLSGAGFKDCSVALDESVGDIEKAIEILRVKGISKASKKMSRSANEGVIAIYENNNTSSIIEINCETDFVAKNNDFINFAKEISIINNEVKSVRDKLISSNMSNGKSVKDNLLSLITKIGEKITIGRSKTLNLTNSKIFKYHHTVVKDNLSKLGVIVSLNTSEDIDKDILKKEQELIKEELINSGKPEDIVKKISLGKLNKFKEENSLLNQQWVMDPKKKVQEVIEELNIENLKINEFFRIKIGE